MANVKRLRHMHKQNVFNPDLSFGSPKLFELTFFFRSTFSDQAFNTKKFLYPVFWDTTCFVLQMCWTHNFFGPEFLLDPKCLNPYYFLDQIKVLTQIFGTKQKFWTNYFFGHTIEFSASLKN